MTHRLGDLLVQYWHREQYTIHMQDGGTASSARVDGIVMAEVPDLGLHVGVTHFVDVTHLPSGKRIGHFLTLGAAVEFVHRIAYLRDWHTMPLELTADDIARLQTIQLSLSATEQRPLTVPL